MLAAWCILSLGETVVVVGVGGLYRLLTDQRTKFVFPCSPCRIPIRKVFMTFRKKDKEGRREYTISQILKRGQKNDFLVSVVWVGDTGKHGINLCSHSFRSFEETFYFLLHLNIKDVFLGRRGEDNAFSDRFLP